MNCIKIYSGNKCTCLNRKRLLNTSKKTFLFFKNIWIKETMYHDQSFGFEGWDGFDTQGQWRLVFFITKFRPQDD